MTRQLASTRNIIICVVLAVSAAALMLAARSFIWHDILQPVLDFWTP